VIEAGCQGTLRVELGLVGERAHTARPWTGRNAIHRLAPVLERLAAYEGRRPVIDGCEYREAMQAVRVEGGVAGNVVPDHVLLTVNHRFAPDRSLDRAVTHVRDVLAPAPGDTFEVVDASPAAAPALDHPVLAGLIERGGLAVRAKLGWTDVARFAEHGIPAANFGPGDATLAHTAGERVAREPIERVYAALDELLRAGV
jgi:succinyl-diaminopimelate desuccinylase